MSDGVFRPMRILIVEDNADTALSFERVFRELGHAAESIGHSGRCLETLASDFRPDRLLVDASLPESLVRKVRERFASAPVVGITGGVTCAGLPPGSTVLQKPAEPSVVLAELEAAGDGGK